MISRRRFLSLISATATSWVIDNSIAGQIIRAATEYGKLYAVDVPNPTHTLYWNEWLHFDGGILTLDEYARPFPTTFGELTKGRRVWLRDIVDYAREEGMSVGKFLELDLEGSYGYKGLLRYAMKHPNEELPEVFEEHFYENWYEGALPEGAEPATDFLEGVLNCDPCDPDTTAFGQLELLEGFLYEPIGTQCDSLATFSAVQQRLLHLGHKVAIKMSPVSCAY